MQLGFFGTNPLELIPEEHHSLHHGLQGIFFLHTPGNIWEKTIRNE